MTELEHSEAVEAVDRGAAIQDHSARRLRDEYDSFVRTGPGTIAGRYLRTFWQPIYHSADLPRGRAVPVKVLGEEFTLYRGESGATHLVGPLCAHRKTKLSTGWVEGDCIRCFYHGWVYDADGRCIEQPPEPVPFDRKVRIPAFPTAEYLGLVFAYLAGGEPPELPRFPNFEDFEGILEWDSYRRDCNYFQNLENSLDHTHVGFVHRSTPGSYDGVTDSPRIEARESIWGVTATVTRPSGSRLISQFGMPNRFHLKGLPSDPEILGEREFLAWWVPIDDESHMQFGVYAVRLPQEKIGQYVERREARKAKRTLSNMEIARAILRGELFLDDIDPSTIDIVRLQDDIAQMGQGAVMSRDGERLGRSDAGLILIRKIWSRELRAFQDGKPLKNWHYDPNQLEVVRNATVS